MFSRAAQVPAVLFGCVALSMMFSFYSSQDWWHLNPSNNHDTQLYILEECNGEKDRAACCSDTSKVALGGIDLVDLWKSSAGSRPTMGSVDYSITIPIHTAAASFQGAADTPSTPYRFLFANADNMMDFLSGPPSKYFPAYGGFDAWAIASSKGQLADLVGLAASDGEEAKEQTLLGSDDLWGAVDMVYWEKVGDQMYWFGGPGQKVKFTQHLESSIAAGDQAWGQLGDLLLEEYHGIMNTNCFRGTSMDTLMWATVEWNGRIH